MEYFHWNSMSDPTEPFGLVAGRTASALSECGGGLWWFG